MAQHRPISEVAGDIRRDWSSRTKDGKVPVYADAYLRPMETLTAITDNYYMDSADVVVLYFLSNASTYRGELARKYKAELKAMLGSK